MSSSRIGAIFYLLWGVLHVNAAVQVYRLGHTLEPGMVQGRIYQDAWTLLFLAVAVALVAIVWNWKSDPFGYWLNLALACRIHSDDSGAGLSATGSRRRRPGDVGPGDPLHDARPHEDPVAASTRTPRRNSK